MSVSALSVLSLAVLLVSSGRPLKLAIHYDLVMSMTRKHCRLLAALIRCIYGIAAGSFFEVGRASRAAGARGNMFRVLEKKTCKLRTDVAGIRFDSSGVVWGLHGSDTVLAEPIGSSKGICGIGAFLLLALSIKARYLTTTSQRRG
jgi:hypothetical protein